MNHTDLALEAHQQVHTGAGTLPGVRIQQQEEDEIDYVIPGNDDAIRAIRLIAATMANAVVEGRQGEVLVESEAAPAAEEAAETPKAE